MSHSNKHKAKSNESLDGLLGDEGSVKKDTGPETISDALKTKLREEFREELKAECVAEAREELREEIMEELKAELSGKPIHEEKHRQWLYSKEAPSGKLFDTEDAVKAALKSGWVDHPGKVK